MKKTMALLGLLFIGVALLFSPSVGVLGWPSIGVIEADVTATSPALVLDDPPQMADAAAPTEVAPSATTSPTSAPATSAPETTSTTSTAIVQGSVQSSRFGSFQVAVTIEAGVIVNVDLIQEPGDRRSLSINQRAVPLYEEAVLEIQGADIDVISGATVTWRGYTASLQAALDEAGLG